MDTGSGLLFEVRHLEDPPRRMPGLWSFERAAWRAGYIRVAGVDEAGRGPLAGLVVAAAVVLPRDFDPSGVNDSKQLTPDEREIAYLKIVSQAVEYGVGVVDSCTIDQINILRASILAMTLAVESLRARPDLCLLDGLTARTFPYPQKPIIKGDGLSVSIAAASIIAKVTRDRLMVDLDCTYPGYGFARHKGYYTPEHIEALDRLGPCPQHRRSFRPCAEADIQKCLDLQPVAD